MFPSAAVWSQFLMDSFKLCGSISETVRGRTNSLLLIINRKVAYALSDEIEIIDLGWPGRSVLHMFGL